VLIHKYLDEGTRDALHREAKSYPREKLNKPTQKSQRASAFKQAPQGDTHKPKTLDNPHGGYNTRVLSFVLREDVFIDMDFVIVGGT
jgi:hypothetical protein